MKKLIVTLFFCLFTIYSFSQKYEVSLSNAFIKTKDIKFADVIDGRKDKSNIGWVQTGLTNKRRIADFENGFDRQIKDLFNRSALLSAESDLLISINRLYINETTKATSEIGRAEIGINFFKLISTDSCYFITSIIVGDDHRGMDVTKKHDENIASAFEKAFAEFLTKRPYVTVSNKAIAIKSLGNLNQTLRDVSKVKILNTEVYEAGIYNKFDELLNNEPSVTSDFIVDDAKKIKLFRLNTESGKKQVKDGIFGFSIKNKIYILFDGEFCELKRVENTFRFMGPKKADPNAVATGAILGGFIGSAVASSSSSIQREYELDIDTGMIYEIGIAKSN
ncbi:MAG: hypothetical protein MUF68_05625 [Cyclobacteriaceae bacterium]|jgi:hypothetical protein|nr:hypothetical protein [Cyclobacteriaceae bacterium]